MHIRYIFGKEDEYNSTKCCYKCGRSMSDIYDTCTGYPLRGIKWCKECCGTKNNIEKYVIKKKEDTNLKCCCLCKKELKLNEQITGIDLQNLSLGTYNLKCCIDCNCKNIIKIRNRDLNAAKNIWLIAYCRIHNLERPFHLRRPKKEEIILPNELID